MLRWFDFSSMQYLCLARFTCWTSCFVAFADSGRPVNKVSAWNGCSAEYHTALRDVQRVLAAPRHHMQALLHVSPTSALPPLHCYVTPLCARLDTSASPVVLCGCHGHPVMTARDVVHSSAGIVREHAYCL